MPDEVPKHYRGIKERFGEYSNALERMKETVRGSGPLDAKTSRLIRMAAVAAAIS
jgi:4-carboxymuconolactone decarboxylase